MDKPRCVSLNSEQAAELAKAAALDKPVPWVHFAGRALLVEASEWRSYQATSLENPLGRDP